MWWEDILIGAFLLFGIYCVFYLIGFRTRMLTSRTHRTAENLYPNFADSPGKQRKYAREHGGTWREDDGAGPTDTL
jgi:hypothetical protein